MSVHLQLGSSKPPPLAIYRKPRQGSVEDGWRRCWWCDSPAGCSKPTPVVGLPKCLKWGKDGYHPMGWSHTASSTGHLPCQKCPMVSPCSCSSCCSQGIWSSISEEAREGETVSSIPKSHEKASYVYKGTNIDGDEGIVRVQGLSNDLVCWQRSLWDRIRTPGLTSEFVLLPLPEAQFMSVKSSCLWSAKVRRQILGRMDQGDTKAQAGEGEGGVVCQAPSDRRWLSRTERTGILF
jgi:hypothetical protein